MGAKPTQLNLKLEPDPVCKGYLFMYTYSTYRTIIQGMSITTEKAVILFLPSKRRGNLCSHMAAIPHLTIIMLPTGSIIHVMGNTRLIT